MAETAAGGIIFLFASACIVGAADGVTEGGAAGAEGEDEGAVVAEVTVSSVVAVTSVYSVVPVSSVYSVVVVPVAVESPVSALVPVAEA